MARQQITALSQGRVAISPVLMGFAVLGFWSGLAQKAADTMCYITCALTGMALQALPGIVLSLGRGLESFALEHGRLLFLAHLLGTLAPLLHWLVGGI
jgi:hypothetical protein